MPPEPGTSPAASPQADCTHTGHRCPLETAGFDADQASYHIELGPRIRTGPRLLIPFLHHVSRHVIDRPKYQLVDWTSRPARNRNDVMLFEPGSRSRALLGLRIGFASGPEVPAGLPLSFPGPP